MPSTEAERFLGAKVHYIGEGSTRLAYRKFGSGPPLLLLHGFPLHGFTYRKVAPYLQKWLSCYIVDLPGAGESSWSDQTNFSSSGHAKNLQRMVTELGLNHYAVLGHDTGGAVARHLALIDKERLDKLVLINTEIPRHRPPWIPLYQRLLAAPGSHHLLRLLLRSDIYLRSNAGFGGCFSDRGLIEGEFKEHFVTPLVRSPRRAQGYRRYLQGFNWKELDVLSTRHSSIRPQALFIWGQDDPTFPEKLGRNMARQFPHCAGFKSIPQTKLLPHEEKPEEVCAHLLKFLLD